MVEGRRIAGEERKKQLSVGRIAETGRVEKREQYMVIETSWLWWGKLDHYIYAAFAKRGSTEVERKDGSPTFRVRSL